MNKGSYSYSRNNSRYHPHKKNNKPFNPNSSVFIDSSNLVYKLKKESEKIAEKTTFINPEMERLEKELKLLTQQKLALDASRKEQMKNKKKEIVVINGDKYIQTGTQLERYYEKPKPIIKSNIVCIPFCKFGSCPNPHCPNIHDRNLVRICPSFLRGCCTNEKCTLSHQNNPDLVPLCSFYLEGRCTNEKCNFRHEKIDPSIPLCKDFEAGYCKEGKQCQFKHLYTYINSNSKVEKSNVDLFLPSFIKLDKKSNS